MDTYSWLRELADSWVLLAMMLFYLAAILFVLRPSAKSTHRDTANIPFRNETPPQPGCGKSCDGCACGAVRFTLEDA